LDRLYTRSEIESISQRVGFSVWDRKGGFWGDKEECRHRWVSNIVIKKGKFASQPNGVHVTKPELELADLSNSDFEKADSFAIEEALYGREKVLDDLNSLKQLSDLIWKQA